MTSNQKILYLALAVFTLFLLVGQFATGQIMGNSDAMRASLGKIHKHLGHTLFGVGVAFALVSMWVTVNTPTRPRAPKA
jgi:hypothetical protein